MALSSPITHAASERRVKSFVVRAGRITKAQALALENLSDRYLLDVSALEPIDFNQYFKQPAPLVCEIGFGMGASLVEMARTDSAHNYVGIEVHPPGVGECLLQIDKLGLSNLLLIQHDAFEVLRQCLAPQSIEIFQIFFPDPWPKKRHVKRRLINDEFINQILMPKLAVGGLIRLATDWEDYAMQMLEVLSRAEGLVNTNVQGGFIPRPQWRPLTKFEQRGSRLGHQIWDLEFKKQ